MNVSGFTDQNDVASHAGQRDAVFRAEQRDSVFDAEQRDPRFHAGQRDPVFHAGQPDLVFHAALVAGMGPQARAIADSARGPVHRNGRDTSCIDAGGRVMFSLHSARPNELGIVRRLNGGSRGIQPWLRTHYRRGAGGIETDEWRSCIFSRENQAQLDIVLGCALESGEEPLFQQVHAGLGKLGRFLYTMQPSTPDRLPAWIGWQLDRHVSPSTALGALGWASLWPEARARMEEFLGTTLTQRSRPWSIAVALGANGMLMRVGSTIWARQPEDRAKRRRMVECMAEAGSHKRDHVGNQEGNSERNREGNHKSVHKKACESLYKLLLPDSIEPFTRVGRAVELEFRDGRFEGITVLLRAGGS